MRHHQRLRITAAMLTALLLTPIVELDAEDARVGRRDLKAARSAVKDGRWSEGLDLYERILASTFASDPNVRREALYFAALLALTASPEPQMDEIAARLEEVTGLRPVEHPLETQALAALFAAIGAGEEREAVLADELDAARQETSRERDRFNRELVAEREARALVSAQGEARIDELQRANLELALIRDALSQRIEELAIELAQKKADLDFLVAQLEGTQHDQRQMLETVMTKNEELQGKERQLRSMRLALEQRQAELETQAEELTKREEAIREITDRVLTKDESER